MNSLKSQKLLALILIVLGAASMLVCSDATVFVTLIFFALPVLFAKEDRR